MKKKILIIIAGVVLAVAGVVALVVSRGGDDTKTADAIREASDATGNIAEKIIGDPDKAKVLVYEYADYGCSHCAEWNRRLNDLLEKYGDDLALVYRAYDIGQFPNTPAATAAATAAQLQGYFKEYKDILFNSQSEWMYESGTAVEKVLVELFEQISDGKGDVDKFKEDLISDAVRKRVNFEQRMGERAKITGTPTFRIDGEKVEAGDLIETIEQKMI